MSTLQNMNTAVDNSKVLKTVQGLNFNSLFTGCKTWAKLTLMELSFHICKMGMFFMGQHHLYFSGFCKRDMISTLLPREGKLSDYGINTFHLSLPLPPATPGMNERLSCLVNLVMELSVSSSSPFCLCSHRSTCQSDCPQLPLPWRPWLSSWWPGMTQHKVLGKL